MSTRLIALAIGYGFGLIQSAYILGKIKGIDIREYGSGNAGTTNAMRVLGTKAGLIVFFMDLLKSVLAIVLVTLLFGGSHPELKYLLKVWALFGCVLGHDYPFYMNFRGGKGVAVMAGFVFTFHWSLIPIEVAAFFIPFLTTHYVSLGSLLVYGLALVIMIIEGQMGVYAPAPQPVLIEMYVLMAILVAMCYWRHRKNIVRLINHTESKTYLHKK